MMFSEFFFEYLEWLPALLTGLMILVFQIRCYRDKAKTRLFFQSISASVLVMLFVLTMTYSYTSNLITMSGVEIFFKHFHWLPALAMVLINLVFQWYHDRDTDKVDKDIWRFFQQIFAVFLVLLILVALTDTYFHTSDFQASMWRCRPLKECIALIQKECGNTPTHLCEAFELGSSQLLSRLYENLEKLSEFNATFQKVSNSRLLKRFVK